jgi:hypothetical protein
MSNCYLCGRSENTTDLVEAKGGVTLHLDRGDINLYDGQFFCEDADDCESELDAKRNDYPEDVEDTPCLDAPWWKNP